MQHDTRLVMTGVLGEVNSWAESILPQFLDMTAGRQIELDVARFSLLSGGDAFEAVQDIGRMAHKIAGTAASFGFAALGDQAQEVEGLCLRIERMPPAALATAAHSEMLPALERLMLELDLILVTPL
ncbi:Hpt domain-containing protein [Pseudorhodobacter sp. MZDSW-24AT]|uniref:Hpt domain-containing protein n=1 Tax=Pseudorhodobacter sp. MZDSW-24AT TaxID=2052957 RepID=UPI000C1F1120|nr:Hpt domain-containing protein [Pseudorhodobacter sp. MZDSW-24AT]PJF09056.1 hypothetical protein CUR21_11380 [Pseudorhodobacter sp. MZDSW-24AT]